MQMVIRYKKNGHMVCVVSVGFWSPRTGCNLFTVLCSTNKYFADSYFKTVKTFLKSFYWIFIVLSNAHELNCRRYMDVFYIALLYIVVWKVLDKVSKCWIYHFPYRMHELRKPCNHNIMLDNLTMRIMVSM